MLKNICLFIVAIIVISLFMSGCSKDLVFDSNKLKQRLNKVEILYYNTSSDSELIISIEENNLDEFINEFSKFKMNIIFGAPGNLEGYCIKMVYKDFSYYLITKNHIEHYDENGKLVREDRMNLNYIQFDELINQLIK